MSDRATCAIIIIGDEILSGRTTDANLPYFARRLDELGLVLRETRVIPDSIAVIASAVNEYRAQVDFVLTTGGIGPTHDDVTARAVADAFGLPVERHPEAARRLESYYSRRGTKPNAARMRMADMPRGATLIDNPISQAPGFQIENVLVLAGVPEIARAMFEEIVPRFGRGTPLVSRTIVTTLPEGAFASDLAELQSRHHRVRIGSYPIYERNRHSVHLVLRADDSDLLSAAAKDVDSLLAQLSRSPKDRS